MNLIGIALVFKTLFVHNCCSECSKNIRTVFSYLLQRSPNPSMGWQTPVDDSPWVMKNIRGLCSFRPFSMSSRVKGTPGSRVTLRTSAPAVE